MTNKALDKKVKLSPTMKEVIVKMNNGYELSSEGKNCLNYFLAAENNTIRLNWNTGYFMKRRGLIEYDRKEKGFWGTKDIYKLTDLGKTITI